MMRGLVVAAMLLNVAGPVEAFGSVTFADRAARERFADYVAFLERDPERFAGELATVERLQRSEVEYRFVADEEFDGNVEGTISTDGERISVNIAGRGDLSANSRIAHELEHARQFDEGELAFERDPASGRWGAHRATYDIGDEVKAWSVQLNASVESDFWQRPEGGPWLLPSLLGEFAEAESDQARARVLAGRGYGGVREVADCNLRLDRQAGFRAGQLVRGRLFGRVRSVYE